MEEDYQALRASWIAGDRDREHALHLLFLSWYHWAEPDFLTGLSYDPGAIDLWHSVFAHFGGEDSSDPEFLIVASIMVEIVPSILGSQKAWTAKAERMRARSLLLRPGGFSPDVFEGRGEYGSYFAHQSEGQNHFVD